MKLQKLTIKNLASIEDAVIDFENGPLSEESLFLICGETGAGKSIIIDAVNFVLGERTSRELIRYGAAKAKVEAVFDVSENDAVFPILKELGVGVQDASLCFQGSLPWQGATCAG